MSDSPLSINQDFAMRAAKGKGCSAKFRMAETNVSFEMFLGGVGMTEFSSTEDRRVPLSTLRSRDLVATDWVNNRFFGNIPALGDVVLDFETFDKSDKRSSAIVLAEGQGDIFPATIVNSLFFQVQIDSIGKTLFNKEPMILKSHSAIMDASLLKADPRVNQYPEGLPTHLKKLLDDGGEADFLPLGTHKLTNPIALYDKEDPSRVVAVMESADVQVVAHYGLEVTLKSSSAQDDVFSVELEIENRMKDEEKINWFASAIRNLELDSDSEGSLTLRPTETATLSLSASKSELKPLEHDDILVVGFSNNAGAVDKLRTAYVALTSGS